MLARKHPVNVSTTALGGWVLLREKDGENMKRFVDKESQADARREFVSELVRYDSLEAQKLQAEADGKATPNGTRACAGLVGRED
jgi:hypothetical protein